MKDKHIMSYWNFLIGLTIMVNLSGPLKGQSVNNGVNEDKTLITVHAEDAFLPSILSILAKESGYNIVTDVGRFRKKNEDEFLALSLDCEGVHFFRPKIQS